MAETLEDILEYALERKKEEEEYAKEYDDWESVWYWEVYIEGVMACIRCHNLNNEKLEHLSRFIPELEEEQNKCCEIINEFEFKGATPLEAKAFSLCGAVMQSLGAILNTLEDNEEMKK